MGKTATPASSAVENPFILTLGASGSKLRHAIEPRPLLTRACGVVACIVGSCIPGVRIQFRRVGVASRTGRDRVWANRERQVDRGTWPGN